MRMRRIAAVLIPTLAATAVVVARPADDDEVDAAAARAALAEAPGEVRAAVQRLTALDAVTEYEREEEDGVTHHEVGWRAADGVQVVVLSDAGDTIAEERAIDPSRLPAAVRAALTERYGDAEIVEAEAVTLHYYEIALRDGDDEREVEIVASGLLDDDDDDDADNDDDDNNDDDNDDEDDEDDDEDGEVR